MKDKLKAIVERAIEKGWGKRNEELALTLKVTKVLRMIDNGRYIVKLESVNEKGETFCWYAYHLSDLLFNHEFMRALCPKPEWDTVDHIYYMEKIVQLPTDQQRIDYVHGLIKGESEC